MAARVLSLEEVKELLGQEIGVSDWLTVDQETIDRFADLTHDRQWIHVDRERAAQELPAKSTIAHGFLTLSLVSHFAHQVFEVRGDFQMTINYGLNRLRFISPVPAGSRIRGRVAVHQVEGNQVIWLITVELDGNPKPALAAEWITRYY
jgi:acyl dehydratase